VNCKTLSERGKLNEYYFLANISPRTNTIYFFLFSPRFSSFHTSHPAAEIGDYDPNKHSYGYVSEFRIVPNQTKELESRIVDIHKQIKGIGPAQAEFNFLDKVKWLDMYGVDLHPVLVSVSLYISL
jgi:FERM central domain